MPVDYDALAAKFGGTEAQPNQVDYDAIAAQYGATQPQEINVTEGIGTGERLLAGIGKGFVDIGRGAGQMLGMVSQADIDESRRLDQPLMDTGAGMTGNVIGNIAALAPTMFIPGSTSLLGAGAIGGGMGALQPTATWESRRGNVLAGAAAGVAGQAVASKVGSYLANKFGARVTSSSPADVDEAIYRTLQESGLDANDLPSEYVNSIRKQVSDALVTGKKLDIPSAVRAKEFSAIGIKPTLGQVTRDPMQYATEQNLRGVAGVGEPLLERMTSQENQMRKLVGGFAQGAEDRYLAGAKIGGALTRFDDAMSKNVSKLYGEARASAGKDMELPIKGLAQDYAQVLRDFGDKVPSGVRNNLESLGLLTGKQNKLFTVEEADRILKVINANQSADPATNAALAQLRNAVKQTVIDVDASGGAFAPAVKAAAQRFQMHDMLPALQQAAKGEIDADKFVAKHIVGAKPEAVKYMSKVLQFADKDAYNQARAQVGEYIRRSAYGINEAGDSAFRPAGYSKAIDSLGERLKAFYSPEEIGQLKRIARVGAYMSAPPAKAAVSTSNSGVPVTNALMEIIANKVPFGGSVLGAAKSVARGAGQNKQVAAALQADPRLSSLAVMPGESEKYQRRLSALLVPAAVGMSQ